MEVSTSYAVEQARQRFAQLRQHLAAQANASQRLMDVPGLKPVENAPVPALSRLRWIGEEQQVVMDVEHSRKMLEGVHARRDSTNHGAQ